MVSLSNPIVWGVDVEDNDSPDEKSRGVRFPGDWVDLGLASADQHGSAAERRRRAAAGSLLVRESENVGSMDARRRTRERRCVCMPSYPGCMPGAALQKGHELF